jgi:hypothetical protein
MPIRQLPTDRQVAYRDDLARRLSIAPAQLEAFCRARYHVPLAELSRADCSLLIAQLEAWADDPADLYRARGQIDLPGMGDAR